MTNIQDRKKRVREKVDSYDSLIRSLAIEIHRNPETGFREYKAVEVLTGALEKAGFKIRRGIAGLETAFMASWTKNLDGPRIAIIAEYDALPKIGHACGHNIIAASAAGAAIAVKESCDDLPGELLVIGTPGEEDIGGKIPMVEKGIFCKIDAVMLCHPSKKTRVLRGGLACNHVTFKYFGKEAHASSSQRRVLVPWMP